MSVRTYLRKIAAWKPIHQRMAALLSICIFLFSLPSWGMGIHITIPAPGPVVLEHHIEPHTAAQDIERYVLEREKVKFSRDLRSDNLIWPFAKRENLSAAMQEFYTRLSRPSAYYREKQTQFAEAYKGVKGFRVVLNPRTMLRVDLEWGAIFDFNERAANIWDQLLTCHAGDVDAARIAYASSENLCPLSAEEGAVILQKLSALHINVDNYLQTAPFLKTRDEKITKEGAEQYFDKIKTTYFLHPLLEQVLLSNELSFNRKDRSVLTKISCADGHITKQLEYSWEDKKASPILTRATNYRWLIASFSQTSRGPVEGLWPEHVEFLNQAGFYLAYLGDAYESSPLNDRSCDSRLAMAKDSSNVNVAKNLAGHLVASLDTSWAYFFRKIAARYGIEQLQSSTYSCQHSVNAGKENCRLKLPEASAMSKEPASSY
jgi:hypothetical protein